MPPSDMVITLLLILQAREPLRHGVAFRSPGSANIIAEDSLYLNTWLFVRAACLAAMLPSAFAIDTVIVRPREIDDVLVNPGIGFTTFQRFNGDSLNQGVRWTEGFPIEYQPFKGDLHVKGQPLSTIAYFRFYLRLLEPEMGKCRWDLIDTALKTAHDRGQTLMLRVAPYGTNAREDVPAWYRAMVGDEKGRLPLRKWMTDPENPLYVKHFGGFVREFGKRYDGNPDVELVDISILGAWGEGAGTELLKSETKDALLACYLETFRNTPLVIQMEDRNQYAARFNVGLRFDCLGDMGGGFGPNWGAFPGWGHMLDWYPQVIIESGLQNAWMAAPVSLEACGVMQTWKDRGWSLDYIAEQSLKWHISSFNNKSSAVPEEWRPKVDAWLKHMGYRFVLRKFSYPVAIQSRGKLPFNSWWENKGVAPVYRPFTLALRLSGGGRDLVLRTGADVRKWLPGDNTYDSEAFLPADLPPGAYDLSLALLDPRTGRPGVQLAIEGRAPDGWYRLSRVEVKEKADTWSGGKYPPP
jgi:hypothetical protein